MRMIDKIYGRNILTDITLREKAMKHPVLRHPCQIEAVLYWLELSGCDVALRKDERFLFLHAVAFLEAWLVRCKFIHWKRIHLLHTAKRRVLILAQCHRESNLKRQHFDILKKCIDTHHDKKRIQNATEILKRRQISRAFANLKHNVNLNRYMQCVDAIVCFAKKRRGFQCLKRFQAEHICYTNMKRLVRFFILKRVYRTWGQFTKFQHGKKLRNQIANLNVMQRALKHWQRASMSMKQKRIIYTKYQVFNAWHLHTTITIRTSECFRRESLLKRSFRKLRKEHEHMKAVESRIQYSNRIRCAKNTLYQWVMKFCNASTARFDQEQKLRRGVFAEYGQISPIDQDQNIRRDVFAEYGQHKYGKISPTQRADSSTLNSYYSHLQELIQENRCKVLRCVFKEWVSRTMKIKAFARKRELAVKRSVFEGFKQHMLIGQRLKRRLKNFGPLRLQVEKDISLVPKTTRKNENSNYFTDIYRNTV